MNRYSQRGVSLVELMIALTLSAILIAGVIQVFASNKKSFEITTDLGLMQESGRIGTAVIAGSVRMAGHWGGVQPDQVKQISNGVTGPGGCNAAWVLATGEPVRGYEGAASIGDVVTDSDLPAGCIASGDYIPDTDLLVVRYADAYELFDDATLAETGNADRFFSRVSVGQQATLFQGSDSSSAVSAIADDDGVYNFGYRTELYFLRPCSIKTDGACTDGIPTLTRLTLSGDQFVQQALVEGVEQMQFEYGTDEDGNHTVDRYQTASDLSHSDDWLQVISVRISLITRASALDLGINEQGTEYLLVGDMASAGSGYVVAAADRHYRRKQYTREINLRNRTRL
jgi:prepilin-type N-terminal cleavage/methylation domain-containing protein